MSFLVVEIPNHTKRFEKQVAWTSPKTSNWFEFVVLVSGTKVWLLRLDFEAKMPSSHDKTCGCDLLEELVPSCVPTLKLKTSQCF